MSAQALRPILSVEDCDEDFYSLCIALQQLGVANPVKRYANSKAALMLLDTESGCAIAREAAVILLDLNMPGIDGRQLLKLFRNRERRVPVVVFSTSSHDDDIAFCRREGANDYLVKPLEFDRWRELLSEFAAKWLPHDRNASTQVQSRCQ